MSWEHILIVKKLLNRSFIRNTYLCLIHSVRRYFLSSQTETFHRRIFHCSRFRLNEILLFSSCFEQIVFGCSRSSPVLLTDWLCRHCTLLPLPMPVADLPAPSLAGKLTRATLHVPRGALSAAGARGTRRSLLTCCYIVTRRGGQ